MTSRVLVASLFAVLLPSALDSFTPDYRDDERAARAPQIWGYHPRAVLGAF